MKFTSLRIAGFKSFVDPVELHIRPGLTGVVGPNGCGKSNLMEALRWVMGANSAKAMRAGGMDDVIFAGSDVRPARNHAEVVLVLDNSDRGAPTLFNDADELEVARRITRGGGSVYRVNGKETRARDVQLLFADASSGANSPALVRQGQISDLIAAKPSNRRKVLEDAAGVAGLHSRRREAELRLNAAETNIARLDDSLGGVERELEALRKQARQAKRYRRVSQDIGDLELRLRQLARAEALSDRDAVTAALSAAAEALQAAVKEAAAATAEAAERA
ncbi:MAG: AAA family ATPase, partial [Caulobacterales bacterium]|nr:AAA family ATPase [Caulobacterales bacterium]